MVLYFMAKQHTGLNMTKTPYEKYKDNPAWPVIEKALNELEENQDIAFQTVPDNVVGYIVRRLDEAATCRGAKQGMTNARLFALIFIGIMVLQLSPFLLIGEWYQMFLYIIVFPFGALVENHEFQILCAVILSSLTWSSIVLIIYQVVKLFHRINKEPKCQEDA